ncbi:hypothetical protein C8Q78DRAFT_72757 [Trametes maxima]|nr:hypothetical protein C8Q78DRAFT_72757 [Trametes maxima]
MQHISTSETPALALDDILHTMSPSPAPQPLPQEPLAIPTMLPPRVSSPEPLDYSELESLRTRVQEYALSPNPRESELAATVLRLVSQLLLHPSPAQLASQADTIADLVFQRELLLRDRADERQRWQSERDSWDRTAEALSMKARAAREYVARDQETQHYVTHLEGDLKTSRRRLADTQARLHALENELSRLRPLLSMQATLLRDPLLWRSINSPGVIGEQISSYAKKWKGKGRASYVPSSSAPGDFANPRLSDASIKVPPATSSRGDADDLAQPTDPIDSSTSQTSRPTQTKHEKHHSHRKDRERERRHRQRQHRLTGLLGDARAECILVAARKIGRLRATIISGLVKERAQSELEPSAHTQSARPGAQYSHNVQHALLSPPTSQSRPRVYDTATGSEQHPIHREEASSSSPPIPLAASYVRHGRSSGRAPDVTQRRLAPSPFTAPGPGGAPPHQPLPTHLHPSVQAYAIPSHGPPHAVSHPGFVYFAPGPGQSGPVPFVGMPVPWAMPGTPTNPSPSQVSEQIPARSSQTPRPTTPARRQAEETVSTPMDSLVSAARTLIEDDDYDGVGADASGSVNDSRANNANEQEAPEHVAPARRRGTRRRAVAPVPDSPVPKRRRVGEPPDALLALPPTASPSTARSTRKTKATSTPAQPQSKPQPRSRAKGKGREKEKNTTMHHDTTHPTDPDDLIATAPPTPTSSRTPCAPPVARIRSGLDVLADQAAQAQERRPSIDPAPRQDSESEDRREGEQTGIASPSAPEPPAIPTEDRSPSRTPHEERENPPSQSAAPSPAHVEDQGDADVDADQEAGDSRSSIPPTANTQDDAPSTHPSPSSSPPPPPQPPLTEPPAHTEDPPSHPIPLERTPPPPSPKVATPPVGPEPQDTPVLPSVPEIESGDEDAEGSVVDVEEGDEAALS